MSQEKKTVSKKNTLEAITALYYSGKVKPSLNKIVAELENDSDNVGLLLLACQCLLRTKSYDELSSYADTIIKLAPEHSGGYYYKAVTFQNTKGKEQDAIKNYNQAISIDEDNLVYLKSKANTHLLLYTDYHLPIKFAEKHRDKAAELLSRAITLIEQKEDGTYLDYFTAGEVSTLLSQNLEAKRYFIKAVNAWDEADPETQDKNIYKDIVRCQKACIKLLEKFTE